MQKERGLGYKPSFFYRIIFLTDYSWLFVPAFNQKPFIAAQFTATNPAFKASIYRHKNPTKKDSIVGQTRIKCVISHNVSLFSKISGCFELEQMKINTFFTAFSKGSLIFWRSQSFIVTTQPSSPPQRRLTLAVGETHGLVAEVTASRQRRLSSSVADAIASRFRGFYPRLNSNAATRQGEAE